MSAVRVLAAVPCLNEEAHLEGLLTRLLADPGMREGRIVVADGGSSDGSQEIVRGFAARDGRVELVENRDRIQAAGVNLAAAQARDARYLVRIDAHAGYPTDYVARLIEAAEESGTDAVTVSMRAVAQSGGCFQRANAAAQNSKLGTGGSAHRHGGPRRFVDHGHHALFRMSAFQCVGGYDARFSHNEDAELDARLTGAGFRILLAPDIGIDYYPRRDARALWRQYVSFGSGRARMLRLHRRMPKMRQMAPIGVLPACAFALLAPWSWLFAAPAGMWLLGCLAYGVSLGFSARDACASLAGFPAALMHLAWSFGYWREMLTRPALGS